MSVSLARLNVYFRDQFTYLTLRDMASPIKVINFPKLTNLFNHKAAFVIASTTVMTCLLIYAFKKVFIDSKSENIDKKINHLSNVIDDSSSAGRIDSKPVGNINEQAAQASSKEDGHISPMDEEASTPVLNHENNGIELSEQELNVEIEEDNLFSWYHLDFINKNINYTNNYTTIAAKQEQAIEEICKENKGYNKGILSFNAKQIFQSTMFMIDNQGFIKKFKNNQYKIECEDDVKSQIIEVINRYFNLLTTPSGKQEQ